MNKLCLLSCLILAVSAHAQSAPRVAFVGDQFVYAWQQSAAFKSNPNWIGAGIPITFGYTNSQVVAAGFPAVLSKHPDYVFLQLGQADMAGGNSPATTFGMEWEDAAIGIIDVVQVAKKANAKIIIGNLVGNDYMNSWLQTFAQNENIPLVNFADPLSVGCYQGGCPLLDPNGSGDSPWNISVPNAAGYQVITKMAQAAIATYGLKIKSGYLSNVETYSGGPPNNLPTPATNINTVAVGASLQFTPMATWSDGVTRPITNRPYGGPSGTWWSSNPKVAAVNQQGFVYAYTPGTATIWFESTTGQTFSPWGMTVDQWYGNFVPAPIY